MSELESALNYLFKIISKLGYLIICKGLLITYLLTWSCEDTPEQMKYRGSQD